MTNTKSDKEAKKDGAFNEGPDYDPENEVLESAEYEAVFTESTVEEVEQVIGTRKVTFTPIHGSPEDPPIVEYITSPEPNEDLPPSSSPQHQIQPKDTPRQLPTPDATPEPLHEDSDLGWESTAEEEVYFDADDSHMLAQDSPIPPDHELAPLTAHSSTTHTPTAPENEETTAAHDGQPALRRSARP
jgi:hypothetical protein